MKGNAKAVGNFRSKFEKETAEHLERKEVEYHYEKIKVEYEIPARVTTYKPDFVLPNGICIETKGIMEAKERQKHILIKSQIKDLDIRFVFYNAKKTITKNGTTTYADWANHNGFKWADKKIPDEWLSESKGKSYYYIKNELKLNF